MWSQAADTTLGLNCEQSFDRQKTADIACVGHRIVPDRPSVNMESGTGVEGVE